MSLRGPDCARMLIRATKRFESLFLQRGVRCEPRFQEGRGLMYKAFAIAGYSVEEVESRFAGMLNAFKYGAPPHGGMAPGIDRIVMLLADTPNIREVVTFPMNQQAQDLLMQAPAPVPAERLRELHIRLDLPPDRRARP